MRRPARRPGPRVGLLLAGLLGLPAPALADVRSLPARPEMQCARVDAFGIRDWQPPPPPPAKPPPPKAPPLPFKYLGRLDEAAGEGVAFLAWDRRVLEARPGQVIDGRYRVDAVEPGRVAFTYLPLQEKQILPTGSYP